MMNIFLSYFFLSSDYILGDIQTHDWQNKMYGDHVFSLPNILWLTLMPYKDNTIILYL